MSIDVSGLPPQALAELAATLQIGLKRLNSEAALNALGAVEQALDADNQHYLWLRNKDSQGSFFECGTARGAADTMATDGAVCYLQLRPKESCPNCFGEE